MMILFELGNQKTDIVTFYRILDWLGDNSIEYNIIGLCGIELNEEDSIALKLKFGI
jgi:hypothetical protein